MTGLTSGEGNGPVMTPTPEGERARQAPAGAVTPRPPVHDDLRNYRPAPDVRHHLADAVLAANLERWAS